MRIIKNRKIISTQWRLDSGENCARAHSKNAHAIFPLTLWKELRAHNKLPGKTSGVLLQPEDRVNEIAEHLHEIFVIALHFPSFREGRGYTQATTLRNRHNFRGEIRAINAHRDNLALMERCGINAYQLAPGENLPDALAAFDEITAYYPLNHPHVSFARM